MKKKLLNILACLSIILIGAFALAGCGDTPPDTNIYVSTEAQLTTAVATNNASIVLKDNIDLTTGIEISKKVTINLNGKNLSAINDEAGDGVFHVIEGGDLTINGEGQINGVGNNDYNMAVYADGGNVVINGGTYTNVGATGKDPSHFDLIYAKNGSQITINGGTFEGQTPAWLLNIRDEHIDTTSIIVKGGIYKGFNPADCSSEGANTNFVANGYQSVENNGTWVVSAIAE